MLSLHDASGVDVADPGETPDGERQVRLRSDLFDRMSWQAVWRSSGRGSASTPALFSRSARGSGADRLPQPCSPLSGDLLPRKCWRGATATHICRPQLARPPAFAKATTRGRARTAV